MKKLIKKQVIVRYFLFFTLILLCVFAETEGGLRPFGLAVFSSLVFARQNIVALFPMYLIANVLWSPNWQSVIMSLAPTILFIITYFINTKRNRKMTILAILLVTLLSETPYIVFEVLWGNVYECVITILITLVSTYVFSIASHAVILRGLKFRLSIDEKISIMLCILVIALSLNSIKIEEINIIYPIFALLLMFVSYSIGGSAPLYFAVTVGLGACFSGGGSDMIALCVIMGIVAVAFQNIPAPFCALAEGVTYLFLTFYFRAYEGLGYINMIAVFLVLLIYAVLPKKFKIYKFNALSSSSVGKSVVNKNRHETAIRLYSLSSVFEDMGRLLKGGDCTPVTNREIAKSIAKDFCGKCDNSRRCFSSLGGDTTDILVKVVDSALCHDRASIMDMPPFITGRCKKLNGLIQEVNNKISSAKIYDSAKSVAKNSQSMLATEMSGVAEILENLGNKFKRPVSFDGGRERHILDELSFHGIDAKEVLVYGDNGDYEVSLVLKNTDAEKTIINQVLSVILGVKLRKTSMHDVGGGYVGVNLAPSPRYDIVYSVKSQKREGEDVSGDIAVIKKLMNGRILFSLSDGMGSGESAESVSDRAVQTVTSFFDAGFSTNVVTNVTNRMLILSGSENYSAIDIMTLDLHTGSADFIKFGAVYTLIKHGEDIEVIEGHALPLGVIENAKPYNANRILSTGDILFFFSNGITDVLGVQDITYEICECGQNVEEMSTRILDLAISRGAKDDATIMVVKIFSTL